MPITEEKQTFLILVNKDIDFSNLLIYDLDFYSQKIYEDI